MKKIQDDLLANKVILKFLFSFFLTTLAFILENSKFVKKLHFSKRDNGSQIGVLFLLLPLGATPCWAGENPGGAWSAERQTWLFLFQVSHNDS